MKKILLPLFLLIGFSLTAQQKDTVTASAKLYHATVYYGYGADLQHTANVFLSSGIREVVISDVALQPDINTIQISCPANVTILSFQHRVYTRSVGVSKESDTIRLLKKQLDAVQNESDINSDILKRISVLMNNNFIAENKMMISGTELIKLTEYYASKVQALKSKLYALQLKEIDIKDRIEKITAGLSDTARNSKQVGQLVLQVLASNSGTAEFDISYFTPNAGWIPAYDIRIATIDNSLKLVYKAAVTQSTGLNWHGVKLSLSTSNPAQGNFLPVITADFLQLYVPHLYRAMNASGLAMAPMMEKQEVSLDDNELSTKQVNKKDNIEDYTLVKESQLNINYDINLPYNIPSDGQPYNVTIKEMSVPASYQHIAIPKLDKDAFLTARLARWDSLSLLPGSANVIMDNVYVGKAFIDPNTTSDTLDISLGRDKRIAVKRTLVKDYARTIVRGTNKIESFSYEIIVKNNKKQAVDMLLKDQYPVSKLKEVEVTVLDNGGAMVDAETGILTWNVKLQPGESRMYKFSYSVKYPKEKTLQTVK